MQPLKLRGIRDMAHKLESLAEKLNYLSNTKVSIVKNNEGK